MGGRAEPPERPGEGVPDGNDEEYRSVVFDESFVRAARLREFSAEERIGDHTRAVRTAPARTPTLTWHLTVFVVLVALSFGTAVHLAVRDNSPRPPNRRPDPLRAAVIPLGPQRTVQGSGTVAGLFAASPAARHAQGAEGIVLPRPSPTPHFSESQVQTALTTAKDYLVASSLDPQVLTGSSPTGARALLDPGQTRQFDESFARPDADGQHAATAWVVRLAAGVLPAAPEVRVHGSMHVEEAGPDSLEVVSRHTFAYAIRPTGKAAAQVSLFTVRRELRFRFDPEGLRARRAVLVTSNQQAGPLDCGDDFAAGYRPVTAGRGPRDDGPGAGTDLYATGRNAGPCGVMTPSVNGR